MKAVRRAVAAVGAGDAAVIERPAPPGAGERGQHMVMMRLGAVPAVGRAEIMVLGRMGVPGEAHRVLAALEQPEQRVLVGEVLVGLGAEIGADRNMHDGDDERVVGRVGEHVSR